MFRRVASQLQYAVQLTRNTVVPAYNRTTSTYLRGMASNMLGFSGVTVATLATSLDIANRPISKDHIDEATIQEVKESKLDNLTRGTTDPKAVYYQGVPLHKLSRSESGNKEQVVLLVCGSFSPVTNFHLYMLELNRDHLTLAYPNIDIIGAIISPVHDKYGKISLVGIGAERRVEMLELATKTSDWVAVSPWESLTVTDWTPTRQVLAHVRSSLNEAAQLLDGPEAKPIQVKLLIGADVLGTMLVPGVWDPKDIDIILGDFGVIVTDRVGSNTKDIIRSSPVLSKYEDNILLTPASVENNISSTLVRNLLREGRTVKHLMPEPVEAYIREHGLYGVKPNIHANRQQLFNTIPQSPSAKDDASE